MTARNGSNVAKRTGEVDIVQDRHDSIDDALDAALEMTFPASDPIAVFMFERDEWNDASVAHQRTRTLATKRRIGRYDRRRD